MEEHFRVKWLRTSASRTEGKRWTWFRARAVLCWMGMTLLTLGVNAPAIILSSAILLASYSRTEMSAVQSLKETDPDWRKNSICALRTG